MGVMKDFDIRIRNGGDDAAGAVNELMAELQRRLLELQASMPRWIPVSEKLPDGVEEVMVYWVPQDCEENAGWPTDANGGVTSMAFYQREPDGLRFWNTNCDGVEDPLNPTHWMPLPAPPTDAK